MIPMKILEGGIYIPRNLSSRRPILNHKPESYRPAEAQMVVHHLYLDSCGWVY